MIRKRSYPLHAEALPRGAPHFTTATSLGTAIANAAVPALIAWNGWGSSYHLFGMLSVVLAVPLFLVLRNGPEPGAQKQHGKRVTAGPAAAGARRRTHGRTDVRGMVRNRDVLLVCVTGFCGFWGLYGFVTWANALMIKGHDVSPTTAGLAVSIFAISAVAVKPVVGFVSDRFFGGDRKILSIVIFGVFAVALVRFGQLSTPTGFLWLAPLLGAAAYGWTPLIVALVPAACSVIGDRHSRRDRQRRVATRQRPGAARGRRRLLGDGILRRGVPHPRRRPRPRDAAPLARAG